MKEEPRVRQIFLNTPFNVRKDRRPGISWDQKLIQSINAVGPKNYLL